MSGAIARLPGEKFAAFAARQKAAQEAERAARPVKAKRVRSKPMRSESTYGEDMRRGERSDDFGESFD